jgi:SAM-dependent methyltransferase
MDVKNAIRTQFEQSEVWDQVSFADKVRAEVSAALVPVDVRSILDLGCGDGRITNLLARQDRFVVGTDISKTALQRVNAYRVLASIDSLPFHSLSFDLVTAFEVLEHLPDDMLRKVLCEIKRVTRRYVIVSVPCRERRWSTMVKCASCGHSYNCYGHLHSFDTRRLHRLLCPEFRIAQQILLSIRGYHFGAVHNWLYWLAKRVGNVWSPLGHAYCPRCGDNVKKSSPGNLFGYILIRLIWRLEIRMEPVPMCIIAMYTRNV